MAGRPLITGAIALLIFLLPAAALPAAAQEPVNAMCPVLTDEAVDPALTVEYQGQVIGLCCKRCVRTFQADPAKYVARIPGWASLAVPQESQADHDHAEDHDEGDVAGIGRLHPLTVHFPIALLLAAALGEILVLAGLTAAAGGARYAHWLGALGAAVAAPLGLILEDGGGYDGGVHETVELHETLGLVTAGLALVSLLLAEWGRRSGPGWSAKAGRALLFCAAAAVVWAGHLGATVTFGPDYLPF